MAAAWDGAEGEQWAAQAERYEATGTRYGEALLGAAAVQPGDTILDIGCGTGSLSLALARLAPSGSVLGVDLSAKMLEHARPSPIERGSPTSPSSRRTPRSIRSRSAPSTSPSASSAPCSSPIPLPPSPTSADRCAPAVALVLSAWREFAENEWITAIRTLWRWAARSRYPLPARRAPSGSPIATRRAASSPPPGSRTSGSRRWMSRSSSVPTPTTRSRSCRRSG